jgi:tRNA pseudouridine38-40 synthase
LTPTYRLLLEYDGTDFAGWQIQPGRRTVQAELEGALKRLFGRRLPTVAASRTDAGVHAAGQPVTFRAPRAFRGDLAAALNFHLPEDAVVLSAREAAGAHARRDAVSKTYEYRLVNRPVRPALRRRDAAWISSPLDLRTMRRAAAKLRARRDFREFGGRSARGRSPFCRLAGLSVLRRGDEVRIRITADRFLHNMARRIAGHLIDAGLGKPSPRATRTAEARGLCLLEVRNA